MKVNIRDFERDIFSSLFCNSYLSAELHVVIDEYCSLSLDNKINVLLEQLNTTAIKGSYNNMKYLNK